MQSTSSVLILGATGAVGNHTALALSKQSRITRLSLLGRRQATNIAGSSVFQHTIDIFKPASYDGILAGHEAAICTLGVGQPSKIGKDEFVRIDHDAVISFAQVCKTSGVRHFELLSSVGADSNSKSFYLRTKGKLEKALQSLRFERLSLFQPSMILTPTNRYGVSQAIALAVTPIVSPLLFGRLRQFRGIPVRVLGEAIAMNVFTDGEGLETLHWNDFMALATQISSSSVSE